MEINKKIDLSGFKMKETLNPKIWDGEKIKSDVKKTLLKIADDYFEGLELGNSVDIEDVTMTGSLANYNWSKYSDVDLHILVDYKTIDVGDELIEDFLKTKSTMWNKNHDIKIYGFDVEIYLQDINEEHVSTGVFSILNNEWVVKPETKEITLDKEGIKSKTKSILDRVDDLVDIMNSDDIDYDGVIKEIEKIQDKIKKMRKSGLDSVGEFSVENMVFKVLRRNGTLDLLSDMKIQAYDQSVTLEQVNESDDGFDWVRAIPIKKVLEDIKVGMKFNWVGSGEIIITRIEEKSGLMFDNGRSVYNPYYRIVFEYLGENTYNVEPGEEDATNSTIFLELWNNGDIVEIGNDVIKESDDGFDWVRDIQPPLGDLFTGDDYIYNEEDSDLKINIYDDKVIFNLDKNFFNDHVYYIEDDWVLWMLISNDGDYDEEYINTDYYDDQEVDYLSWSLTPEIKNRIKTTITNLGYRPSDDEFKKIFNDSFSDLQKYLGTHIYKGRHDWEDFMNESISSLSYHTELNNMKYISNYYKKTLKDNDLNISFDYYSDIIKIEVSYPYKGIYNLSDVIGKISDIMDQRWSESYYDNLDSIGSEVEIRDHMTRLLDKLDEVIEERSK